MRIALLQFAAGLDVDENLATITRLARDARADVIVAPEAAMHDFGEPAVSLAPIAQPLDGPFVGALQALARSLGSVIIAGIFEQSDDDPRPFNTVVTIDPDGSLRGTYRKVHLYDSFGYRESDKVKPGPVEPTTVDLSGVRAGLLTCYDLRFPEHTRALVDAGADVVIAPSAWVRGPLKEDHWQTLIRARAIENTIYVAAAAQCGATYCGRSIVVDPLGVVTAALGEQEGSVVADVDPERIAVARDRNPALGHRRFSPIR
jgi:predicted amidohydrolase